MKKVTQTIILAGTMLVMLFTDCSKKGNMGPAGPQGPQGATGDVSILANGYINGTINGFKTDGTAFVETFTYTTSYNVKQSSVDSISPTSYDFSIVRGSTDHVYTEFSADLHFNANSLSPFTVTTTSFKLTFAKANGANEFVFYTASSGISPSITGVVYDKTTGVITGNYIASINGSQNSTGNFAVVSGSFKATVAQLYHKEIKTPNQLEFN